MNCSACLELLDDFVDGALAADQKAALQRHLEECTDCRRELEALQRLIGEASRLGSREVAPPRDLWPAIAARVEPTGRREHRQWLQLAAAAITLLVLSIPLSVWWVGHRDSTRQAVVETEQERSTMTTQSALARSEDGVLLPRTDLVAAVERRRGILDDRTLTVIEHDMQLLDRAIGELWAALDEDPQNLQLRMLLAARYQQERKLLQKVSRV